MSDVCFDCRRPVPTGRCYACHPGNPTGVNGPRPRGEHNTRPKLTDAGVARLRAMAAAGVETSALAEEFGVHKSTVRRAVRRVSYQQGTP